MLCAVKCSNERECDGDWGSGAVGGNVWWCRNVLCGKRSGRRKESKIGKFSKYLYWRV
jgi:hypothetical protein